MWDYQLLKHGHTGITELLQVLAIMYPCFLFHRPYSFSRFQCYHLLPFFLGYIITCYFVSADSKTIKEEKREELFDNLKANESLGWAVDVLDPRELSAKMLKRWIEQKLVYRLELRWFSFLKFFPYNNCNRNKINLNEISHQSAMGLIDRALKMGVLLTEVNFCPTHVRYNFFFW